jgi:hypothetical protein
MKFRLTLLITLIGGAILGAGYRLSQTELEVIAAAPKPAIIYKEAPISSQATTVEEIIARQGQPGVEPVQVFEDGLFGYQLSYPIKWTKTQLSSHAVAFQSPEGATRVKVEVASVLPADGLAAFVDRSLGPDILLTRQQLTIHGFPAERVLVFSDAAGDQVTYFYLNADNRVYIVTGFGEQKAIEAIARSFNASQLLALQ